MSNIQEKFGARLKELRKRSGFTQEQLAEKLNIGLRSYGKLERGKGFPSKETLEKLPLALDITFPELFDFEHLQSNSDLKELTFAMIEDNPNKITEIYKVVKALVS